VPFIYSQHKLNEFHKPNVSNCVTDFDVSWKDCNGEKNAKWKNYL